MEPKPFAALLILVVLTSGLLMAAPAEAYVPKPSVPSFTVQYVDHSYDVPTTYDKSMDPFTGKEITKTHRGYHVDNKTIDITIKNQPYTEVNINGSTVGLHYRIQIKGHFVDWDTNILDKVYPAINSGYTVIIPYLYSTHLKDGDQVDFRVKAEMGYYYEYSDEYTTRFLLPASYAFETIAESDWSGTQTLEMGNPVAPKVTPFTTAPPAPATPTPTAAPTNPPQTPTAIPDQLDNQITDNLEKEVTIIIVLAVVAAALVTLVYMRRRTSQ